MSSRASNKLRFSGGERVLCYEPDLTKAKVLYDSKVLDVVITKDSKGKKVVEYLIHFQGWNSSWDRCVNEEFVLKDTPENRQLQKDLADQSQLQIGAYLYRRERKKQHVRKPFEPIPEICEDGDISAGSPAPAPVPIIDTEESASALSSSEAESCMDVEDEVITLELSEYLRNILEHDYHMINNKNKLMKLPAEPNIVAILENYWNHYSSNLLSDVNGKPSRRLNKTPKAKPENIQRSMNICKEMLDGLRIYFDFTLTDLLLYKKEKGQVDVGHAKNVVPGSLLKQDRSGRNRHVNSEYSHLLNIRNMLDGHQNNHIAQRTRRRSLRSNRNAETTNTNGHSKEDSVLATKEISQNSSVTNSEHASDGMGKLLNWRLLPDYVYNQKPLPPSLIYGATHLLRLFVKLPELLNASGILENKLKVLQEHLELFLNYLNDHKEWYGDKYYIE